MEGLFVFARGRRFVNALCKTVSGEQRTLDSLDLRSETSCLGQWNCDTGDSNLAPALREMDWWLCTLFGTTPLFPSSLHPEYPPDQIKYLSYDSTASQHFSEPLRRYSKSTATLRWRMYDISGPRHQHQYPYTISPTAMRPKSAIRTCVLRYPCSESCLARSHTTLRSS